MLDFDSDSVKGNLRVVNRLSKLLGLETLNDGKEGYSLTNEVAVIAGRRVQTLTSHCEIDLKDDESVSSLPSTMEMVTDSFFIMIQKEIREKAVEACDLVLKVLPKTQDEMKADCVYANRNLFTSLKSGTQLMVSFQMVVTPEISLAFHYSARRYRRSELPSRRLGAALFEMEFRYPLFDDPGKET